MDNFHGIGCRCEMRIKRRGDKALEKQFSHFIRKAFESFIVLGPTGATSLFHTLIHDRFVFRFILSFGMNLSRSECRVIVIMLRKLIVIRLQSPEALQECLHLHYGVGKSFFRHTFLMEFSLCWGIQQPLNGVVNL